MPFPPLARASIWFPTVFLACACACLPVMSGESAAKSVHQPEAVDHGSTLRLLAPDVLEIELIQGKAPGNTGHPPWNFATPAAGIVLPRAEQFAVKAGDRPVGVKAVGLKRRALQASVKGGELRVGTWVYLTLERPVSAGEAVAVENPDGELWRAGTTFRVPADETRESPAIHVNQAGYLPDAPKKAMVGYYLGSLGELPVPAANGFRLVNQAGKTVYEGKLTARPDQGYTYSPVPYQQVFEADFSDVRTPGDYRLLVPGLGASFPFRIDKGIAMGFARTYALGIYHQRCGTDNALPFTRFVHAACHLAPAQVPVPQAEFPFTWKVLASRMIDAAKSPPGAAPGMKDETAQLYPYVHLGTINVAGGHHDAGDYSKYTTNSAAFIHTLIFAVDAIPGAAACDNLGLPESGDGIPDLLQEAKWETDFLARMQDDDGGFYFLVYPRDRAYESNVLPDHGDPQVVWPKNTAATAAAVAALAQAASSPRFRQAYPDAAAAYLAQARKGWRFLVEAVASHGLQGAYQRLTHYGDNHGHDDELAWAAAELFLATGEEEYHRRFREWCDPTNARIRRWGWWRMNESWGNAIRSYAFGAGSGRLAEGKLDAKLLAACQREIEEAGHDALRSSDESAYGTSFPAQTKRMRGGGWYFSLDQAFDLVVASLLDYPRLRDPRPRFLEAYLANLNYEAGTNPVNRSCVTGWGRHQALEVVHQYAENDRRVLPPTGLPVGNIQAVQSNLPAFPGELKALSFPEDDAATAPYPFYDRWTDAHNVSTEFVILNQARALAGLVWLAGKTDAARQPWRFAQAKITGLPEKTAVGEKVTARLEVPGGFEVKQAQISWEAAGGQVGQGETFTFTSAGHGSQWVEAEAVWPDGRRLFAVDGFASDNGLPVVTVTAPKPEASVAGDKQGAFQFHRTGDLAAPLVVHFQLRGSANKWSDYRRPEGDMPQQMTIPAGKDSVTMSIRPMAAGLGASVREIQLSVAANSAYNVGKERDAKMTLRGEGK